MISKTSKYAIKAVIYLGIHSGKSKKILTREISPEIRVSESYLAKILQDLSRNGIVSSTKGRNGGFYLTEENCSHSLSDIIRVVDGEKVLDSCVLGISNCDLNNPCPLHGLVGKGKTEFNRVMEETKIRDVIANLGTDEAFFPH